MLINELHQTTLYRDVILIHEKYEKILKYGRYVDKKLSEYSIKEFFRLMILTYLNKRIGEIYAERACSRKI